MINISTIKSGISGTLDTDLEIWCSMDGNIDDESGNSRDLSCNTTLVYGADKDGVVGGQVILPDQGNKYLYYTDTYEFLLGKTWSISAWIKTKTTSGIIVEKLSSNLRMFMSYGVLMNYTFELNGYYHVVYTSSPTESKFYVNGVLTYIGASVDIVTNADKNIYIGNNYSAFYYGLGVDELRIYSKTLTSNTTSINQVASGEVGDLFEMGVNYATVLPANVITNKILDLKTNQFACTLITGTSRTTHSTTTLELSASEPSYANNTNQYAGSILEITSGTYTGQQRIIKSYVESTKIVTIETPWAGIPEANVTYKIYFFHIKDAQSGLKVINDWVNGATKETPIHNDLSGVGSGEDILVVTHDLVYKNLIVLYEDTATNKVIARKIKSDHAQYQIETTDLYESSIPAEINTLGSKTFVSGKKIALFGTTSTDAVKTLANDYYNNVNKTLNVAKNPVSIPDNIGIFDNSNFTFCWFDYSGTVATNPIIKINYTTSKGIFYDYQYSTVFDKSWTVPAIVANTWYFKAIVVKNGIANFYQIAVGLAFYESLYGCSASGFTVAYHSTKEMSMKSNYANISYITSTKYFDRSFTVPELKIIYERGMSPIEAPTDLVAISSPTSIELSWKIPNDSTGCKVYRATVDEDNAYEFIASVAN